jgi:acyl-CoA reductase-like NAD-dependent aldehyde dehydrogenase
VLIVLTCREPEAALQIANDSPSKAHTLAARIEAGRVYHNNYFDGGMAAPRGGY